MQLLKKGGAICFQYNGDKKLAFYAKPDWVGTDERHRIILPKYAPSAEMLARIPEEKLNPEFITWSDEKRKNSNIQ